MIGLGRSIAVYTARIRCARALSHRVWCCFGRMGCSARFRRGESDDLACCSPPRFNRAAAVAVWLPGLARSWSSPCRRTCRARHHDPAARGPGVIRPRDVLRGFGLCKYTSRWRGGTDRRGTHHRRFRCIDPEHCRRTVHGPLRQIFFMLNLAFSMVLYSVLEKFFQLTGDLTDCAGAARFSASRLTAMDSIWRWSFCRPCAPREHRHSDLFRLRKTGLARDQEGRTRLIYRRVCAPRSWWATSSLPSRSNRAFCWRRYRVSRRALPLDSIGRIVFISILEARLSHRRIRGRAGL